MEEGYDFIGDIHGQVQKLRELLGLLGYREHSGAFHAPRGRRAVFVGDLIDPKPSHPCPGGVRATLHLVRAMCDAGQAICLLGNHELNAVHFHTEGPDGAPLRPHSEKNVRTHQGTLDDFPDHADPGSEWRTLWLPWFCELPMFFEQDGVRAVHACWDPRMLERVRNQKLADPRFLLATGCCETPEWEAMETLLKGLELPIPGSGSFIDSTGVERWCFRVRWWEQAAEGVLCRNLVFPMNPAMPALPMPTDLLECLRPYPEEASPLFFGHYLKPVGSGPRLEAPNLACLDYSAAKGGPLVAYRWSGEKVLSTERFVGTSGSVANEA